MASVVGGLSPAALWLIAAALLAAAEIVAPGLFLIWIGGAALVAGLVALAFPAALTFQIVVFAILAVALVAVARRWFAHNPIPSADPLLNNRGERLIGSIVVAVEQVDASGGRVRVGDSVWSARGEPAQLGERLRVVGWERNVLLVQRLSPEQPAQ